MTALAAIENMTMRYPTMTALDNVSLSIADGSYTVLVLARRRCYRSLAGFCNPRQAVF
jgi:hypothetical protein